jgi:3-deoxy-manno-octulosonate cytidylyltransferase (CMP-KDO synthetase)
MNIIGVIPARYGSTRLEGKPLKDICGKPMIQYVYETVLKSELLTQVIVATDDQRIVDVVEKFGGIARLTSINHTTGTDRIAEVAKDIEAEIVVNIQGDEPLLDVRMIDEAIRPLISDPDLKACTLCRPILKNEDLQNPNVVKAVFDRNGNGLYFSHSLIPFPRKADGHQAFEHIGIYVYRKDFLMEYIKMPQTPLEKSESLEQLRILENGVRLKVVKTAYDYNGLSVDTQEDLDNVRRIVAGQLGMVDAH